MGLDGIRLDWIGLDGIGFNSSILFLFCSILFFYFILFCLFYTPSISGTYKVIIWSTAYTVKLNMSIVYRFNSSSSINSDILFATMVPSSTGDGNKSRISRSFTGFYYSNHTQSHTHIHSLTLTPLIITLPLTIVLTLILTLSINIVLTNKNTEPLLVLLSISISLCPLSILFWKLSSWL